MQTAIGGQRVVGPAAIANQIAAVDPVLDVQHSDGQRRRLFGDEAAILQPDLLELGKVGTSERDTPPQAADGGVRRRPGQPAAEVDEARTERRRLADPSDVLHGSHVAVELLWSLAEVEVDALHVGPARLQVLERRDGFARGHAEWATKPRIACVALAGSMNAHADAPSATEREWQQGRQLAG